MTTPTAAEAGAAGPKHDYKSKRWPPKAWGRIRPNAAIWITKKNLTELNLDGFKKHQFSGKLEILSYGTTHLDLFDCCNRDFTSRC